MMSETRIASRMMRAEAKATGFEILDPLGTSLFFSIDLILAMGFAEIL